MRWLRPDGRWSSRSAATRSRVRSPQTLADADRRVVGLWAADCADRVLGLFEAAASDDARPAEAIAGIRAFARGELRMWPTRSLAGHAHAAARDIAGYPAAVAAARAAGQAAATAHMGAHSLGAAAYAAKAARLANPDRARRGRRRDQLAARPALTGGPVSAAPTPAGRYLQGRADRPGPTRLRSTRGHRRRVAGPPLRPVGTGPVTDEETRCGRLRARYYTAAYIV